MSLIWDFIASTLNDAFNAVADPIKRVVPDEWWPGIIAIELFLILGLYLFGI